LKMVSKVSRERIERACRMCKSTGQAAQMVGMSSGGFIKRCRDYGIQTPFKKRQLARKEKP
jgi:hypothetical protein